MPYSGAGQVGYELFGMKAFFDGGWKILWMPPPFGTGDWELYNLIEDPGELVDLSDQHPERLVEDDFPVGRNTRRRTGYSTSHTLCQVYRNASNVTYTLYAMIRLA